MTKIQGWALFCAAILASIFIYFQTREDRNFEDFALGVGTQSYFKKENDYLLHINKLNQEQLTSLKSGWKSRGKNDVFLILGNSQTHGINQYTAGDENYNILLYNSLQEKSIDVLTHSLPNANLQEFLVSYEFIKGSLPVKYLAFPVFFDDLREEDIREVYFPAVASQKFQLVGSESIAKIINKKIAAINLKPSADGENQFAALDKTDQEKSEEYLNAFMNDHSRSWRLREKLRGEIFTNLYLLRNTVLGISAQTKRPLRPDQYGENMAALKELLNRTKNDSVKVLCYIPPIRSDVEIPYFQNEYDKFKQDLQALTKKYPNVHFANLEGIVPGEYWGTKEATSLFGDEELDFMHFQAKGHALLFKQLLPEVKHIIQ